MFETLSSQRATASKQTLQNIVMATQLSQLLNIQHDTDMTFSREINRLLDFGSNIVDAPDERISVQEIEVSVPTRKRRIGRDLSK